MSSAESQTGIVSADFPTRSDQGFTTRSLFDRQILLGPEASAGALVEESVAIWFQKYHPWFPIIHESSARSSVHTNTSRYCFVFKAITAVVVLDDERASPQHRQIAERMRDEVMQHGMATTSLQSIQAFLILSTYYYTNGHLSRFWNILAMCQR